MRRKKEKVKIKLELCFYFLDSWLFSQSLAPKSISREFSIRMSFLNLNLIITRDKDKQIIIKCIKTHFPLVFRLLIQSD